MDEGKIKLICAPYVSEQMNLFTFFLHFNDNFSLEICEIYRRKIERGDNLCKVSFNKSRCLTQSNKHENSRS